MLKHTGEKPHGCDFCPKRFTSKQNLRAHMKAHIEEFLFHCPGCLQGFDGKNGKEAHEANCTTRRYECHLCKDSFGSIKANLMNHMCVHSGNKPFQCNECFKLFARKSHLKGHMKVHGGLRSFRCTRCRLGFVRQDERNAHEAKCNRCLYECYVCGKSFSFNKSNLIDHMRTHSGDTPFECQRCLKQFTHKVSLNKHIVYHTKKLPFKCSICHQGFAKQSQCKAYETNCNRRCYECHLCKKFIGSVKTNMERHMRTHSGDKPFQCELCHTQFTSKGSHQRHLNLHQKRTFRNT
ncbi:zinc finger protein 84-like [Sitodiplosis mosellana]|uniref:zinc finger protein 84-like n=1 Tax=Sitodiplosis mosellana TaxID=263140 RepID=UPI00244424DD|nr:zinc finger protein 84-like [Sitodiplosis mosellana]